MIAGTIGIYSFLIDTGQFIYGNFLMGLALFSISVVAVIIVRKQWKRIN